jgi:hypothetical protein
MQRAKMSPFRLAAIGAVLAVFLSGCSPEASPQLPALGAKIDETSVSGISSGAYMAGQFEMAHARIVTGAAIIAGGPYGCAQSLFADMIPGPGAAFLNLSKAVNGCMLNALMPFGVPDVGLLADKAKRLAEDGRIDPIEDVKSDRVYLFTGKEDRTVVSPIVAAARDYYGRLGVPEAQIKYVADVAAGHAFVTDDEGLACDRSEKPYVVDCDYDQAGELLSHIYGPLQARSSAPAGRYIVFDQRPFTHELADHSLSDLGVVYVPQACVAAGGCRIHIAFHGCAQNRDTVDDSFIMESGFARWADTNRLIVLFPQTATTLAVNPQGCWDWWGYTGHDYLTRDASQIVAVYRMLERLAASRS